MLAATLGCVAGGCAAAGLRAQARRAGPLPALARAQANASVLVVATRDPVVQASSPPARFRPAGLVILAARAELVTAAGRSTRLRTRVLVLATGPGWSSLLPSQRLRVEGKLLPSRSGDEVSAVVAARGPPTEVQPPSRLQRIAGRLRAGLREAAAGLPADERGCCPDWSMATPRP